MRRLVDFRSKKSKAKAGICRAVFNILRVNRAGCHGCAGLTSASSRSTGTARRRGRRAAASTASTASTGCATSFHKIFPTRAYSAEAMMRTHTTSKRPIIFVAHSLGGIVVKSVLNHSDAARRGALKEHRAIKLLTYGILFIGTPHQGGSGVALGKLMVNVASVFMAADDRLLQHLERDSEWLQQQLGTVVPRASAVVPGAADGEPIAIHADHIHMVKFESKTDPGYRTVSGHLRVMAARAVHSNEPVASFAVQSIVPEVSRVDHFVGRSEELDAIHRELEHDGSRKTAVVHGLGGMVKTQLALAYAQQHKDDYSAVFWVNSKDVDTLKQGYAAAARRVYREHPSLVHLKAVAQGSDLDEAAEAQDVDARRLAEELDGLPLAFATAGAYLHLVPDSFAEYLQSYKESWAQLKQDTPQLLSYEDRTLYTTWGISFDHVKKQSSLATKLLQLWAYFDNQDVWLQLLQEGRDNAPKWFCELTRDRLVFNKAVRVLCDHALVEADTTLGEGGKESRGYGMHSCGHAWTKHVVNGGWDDGMARLALRCVGLHVPSTDALQYWVTQQRLLRHANQCHSSVNTVLTGREDDITIMDAVHGLGDLYRNQGKLDKAEEM
ncbi:tetratricopeptide repeat domain containing protein [Pyrenophora tritici-repentis]|nr:Tetratricopeptide repeat-containing domain protein [Pyrenophora tritici-repentis]KAI1530353.1 tetratricopeptide repeat domain containing protein [Pyrenophora tritici-repentis]KAI1561004.1 tetratricopeptide repeat domain containing protein [Pyrenophora tritici-repentis]